MLLDLVGCSVTRMARRWGWLTILVAIAVLSASGRAYGCERYSAPFFRGSGGFVVEPKDGRSAEVAVEAAGENDTRTVFAGRDGLVVQLLRSPVCTASGGVPRECQVTFSGVRGGGWYWVNGERNAAVAPLMCEDDLGGAAALDPGGVKTTRGSFGTGTLFVHDTQGLMGIVPHLSQAGGDGSQSCERYVAPYFRGKGGFVARPEGGQALELTIGRGSSTTRRTLNPRSDGLVVQLLSDSQCTDSNGQAVECQISLTGTGEGGWYWMNGDRNAAVAPLMCEERLAGAPALKPRGVETVRGAFGNGSLFVHATQGLMGIVPHLSGSADDERQVEVRVSRFGGGTVEVVGDAELNCPVAKQCTGSYPAAGSLTLRAAGSFGYAFDRWQGCDSVSGADCVVALHADRQVSVDFMSTQPLALKDNVVSFDEYRVEDIEQYDPYSGLMVLASYARVDDIGVGSVLVSSVIDPGRGFESFFLRRVTELEQGAGSPAYLSTTPATLEDLIGDGSLAVRKSLGSESVSAYTLPPELAPVSHRASDLTVRELPDGRRSFKVSRQVEGLDAAAMPSLSAPARAGYVEFSVSKKIDDGLEVTGRIGFRIEPSFMLEAEASHGLREFKGQAVVDLVSRLEVGLTADFDREYRVPLEALEITFAPILAGPVVIVPSLTGSLFLKVSLNVGVEPYVELSAETTAGAHYVRGEGWTGLWEFVPDVDLGISARENLATRFEVEAGLPVTLNFKFYGVAGPFISVAPSLGAKIFPLVPPNGPCFWDYDPYLGIRAEFGGEIKMIGWRYGFSVPLVDKRTPEKFGRNCPEGDVVPPTAPGSLRFPSTTSQSVAVEWDAPRQTGSGYSVYYEVVRTYDPGRGLEQFARQEFRVADTRFLDDRLFPDTEYCYEVRSVVAGVAKSPFSNRQCERTRNFDVTPPTAPAGVAAEAVSSGVITVRWDASVDDEGVSHYVIVQEAGGAGSDEAVQIGNTEGLSFDVAGLKPNREYCFGVSAVDDAGNASPVVGTACASTLEKSGPGSVEVTTFDLADENRSGAGIAYAQGRFYVVDQGDRKVYAYRGSDFRRDEAADFDLDYNNKVPAGIEYAEGRFYVADIHSPNSWSGGKVYAYRGSDGRRDEAADFELFTESRNQAAGIAYAEGRLYAAYFETPSSKVYAYRVSDGRRDEAADFDLITDRVVNVLPSAMAYAEGRFYVVGSGYPNRVYTYRASDGRPDEAADFDLDYNNALSTASVYAEGRLYVLNRYPYKVYAYSLDRGDGNAVQREMTVKRSRESDER